VLVGIANDRGNIVHENNPKISKYLQQGKIPSESTLVGQVDNFSNLLEEQGVKVFRPKNIPNQDQIFTRDISFVIDDKIIKSKMKKENRKVEQEGIDFVFDKIYDECLLTPPDNAYIEGGDVIVHKNYIFVGLSSRTNHTGYEFLRSSFPKYEVIPFQLFATDNPATNILHLDCALQTFGGKYALIYEDGFVHYPDSIIDIIGDSNLVKVTQYEMYHMNPNIFSIAPDKIVSDKSFKRINQIFYSLGIQTIEIDYQEVSKLGGLFRCSTLPLIRE